MSHNTPDPRVLLLREILYHPDTKAAITEAVRPLISTGTWEQITVDYGASVSHHTPIPCVAITTKRDGVSRTSVLANPPHELVRLNVVEVVLGHLALMDDPHADPHITEARLDALGLEVER